MKVKSVSYGNQYRQTNKKHKKMKNKKVVRLTESDLTRLVKRVISESKGKKPIRNKKSKLIKEGYKDTTVHVEIDGTDIAQYFLDNTLSENFLELAYDQENTYDDIWMEFDDVIYEVYTKILNMINQEYIPKLLSDLQTDIDHQLQEIAEKYLNNEE